jgi:shikimate kinase
MVHNTNSSLYNGNKNIALIGMPGCGKTTVGKRLADKLDLPFYDVDRHIEIEQGKTISDIFLEKDENYFRKLESRAITEIAEKAPVVIATGGGAVKIPENIDVLNTNSIIIFINRDIEDIIADIETETRPLLSGRISQIHNLFQERYPLYKKYAHFEVLNDISIEDTINKILEIIINNK